MQEQTVLLMNTHEKKCDIQVAFIIPEYSWTCMQKRYRLHESNSH